jgi:hypothetical protein
MKEFIAIVSSSGGKITKYQDFAIEADADTHVVKYGGFVTKSIDKDFDYIVVDVDKKTLTYNSDANDKAILANTWATIRTIRDAKLSESDWMSLGDSPAISDAWTEYRTALRNLPGTLNDVTVLEEITWPTEPG